ncbi:MAG: methyltransferase [Minisyncoccia bacterium]
MNINPEITQNFVKDSRNKAVGGVYRVEVNIGDKKVPIDVYPEVFPPKSNYSVSSRFVYETFGNLSGMKVADIGSGTGIESIVAILAGAAQVDATDMNPVAVACTKQNVQKNGFDECITVYQGDLFSSLPQKKYDLIIANLPIVNFSPEKESGITTALYDPDFRIHKRMFQEGKAYLAAGGLITFTHANLQSAETESPDKDFNLLEEIIRDSGYEVVERRSSEALGFKWINYKVKVLTKPTICVKGSDGKGYYVVTR